MLFSPALFQCKLSFGSATAFKDNVVWHSEMGDVMRWMLKLSDESTIVAATDGRSPKVRNILQTIAFGSESNEQKHFENHICYSGIPRNGDIHFPSRICLTGCQRWK